MEAVGMACSTVADNPFSACDRFVEVKFDSIAVTDCGDMALRVDDVRLLKALANASGEKFEKVCEKTAGDKAPSAELDRLLKVETSWVGDKF